MTRGNHNLLRRFLSTSTKDFCMKNLPSNFNIKSLIYCAKTNEFLALGKDNKLNSYRLGSNVGEVSPEKLVKIYGNYQKNTISNNEIFSAYSIEKLSKEFDEDLYLEFVEELHPCAVEIHRIRQNRENISFYNHSIPSSHLNLEIKDYDDAVRSLSKAIHFLPLLSRIINDDHQKGQKLLHNFLPSSQIDPITSLNNYLETPHASPSFFKRVGNMHKSLIKEMYDFIYSDIVDANGIVDNRLYGKKIINIPKATAISANRHDSLKSILMAFHGNNFFSKNAKHQMFEAIAYENEWCKNKETILLNDFESSIGEYLSAISLQLILPSYIDKFNDKVAAINFNKNKQSFPDKYDHWFVKYITKEISSFLQDSFIKDSPRKIYEYSKEYENKASHINMFRPLVVQNSQDKQSPQWSKAFEDCQINNVAFRCLTNERELKEEADNLYHCAAGYGPRCRAGIRHVVSAIVKETGERFTLRFSTNHKDQFYYDEVVTKKDEKGERESLSAQGQDAIQTLINKIASKEIRLNPVFGNINKDFTISDAVGFDITNKTQQEDLFHMINSHPILPTMATNFEDFKAEIGLETFLNKVLDRHIILLSENKYSPPPVIAAAIGYAIKGPREGCGYLD